MDFLIVPTVGFKLLFVLVILGHQRRHDGKKQKSHISTAALLQSRTHL